MRNIQALAIDLDGTTLLPGAILAERTIRALKACIRLGIQVIISTGRSVASAEPYRTAIGAEGPMVCYNGAEVVAMPGETVLGATLLDPEILDFCLDLARKEGVYFQVYCPKTADVPHEVLRADKNAPEAEGYRAHTGIQPVFGDLKTALAAPGFKGGIKCMFLTDQGMMERLRPAIIERFGDHRSGGRVYIAQTSPTFLEVMAAGVSKGRGLALAMDHLGLTSDEVIAFGDEENDLPMFTVAGHSAAPANAKPQVLAAADRVIGPCAGEGLAAFLEDEFGV
ncbi:haloacid dehalogenase [Spirochaetia bacterium]|nr:haloacid dehalogenase [Spirochaetia bacterium]